MKTNSRSTSILILIVAALCGLLLGWLAREFVAAQSQRPPKPYRPALQSSASSAAQLSHPLTLSALGARSYGQGGIREEATLSPGENYTAETVSYASGELKLYALMATPKVAPPAGGYPTVILAHGFMPGDQYDEMSVSYRPWIEGLTAKGYLVVQPDYRGHGRSWGAAESAYYANGYAQDVLALAALLKQYQPVQERQIGVLGHSLGGHVALKAAMARPDLIKTVALAASSSATAEELYGLSYPSEGHSSISSSSRESVIRIHGEPSDASPFWRSTSPSSNLQDLRQSVWLAHCTDDANVPKALSDRLYERLSGGGKDVSYTQCEAGGHGFSAPAGDAFMGGLIEFLDSRLR